MIANATLRSNAVSGVKQLSTGGILLPFLYRTPTICADLYGTAAQTTSQSSSRLRWRESDEDRPRKALGRRRPDHVSEERSYGERLPRQSRESGSNHSNERPSTKNHLKSVREDHIPFERAVDEKYAIQDVGKSILDGSTVTPGERKAFESLLHLQRGKQPEDKGVHGRDKQKKAKGATAVQDGGKDSRIMPQALNRLVELGLSEQEAATTLSSKPAAAVDISLDKAIASDVSRVDSLMKDAQTDVDLWRVLHEQVINRVLGLGLDAPEDLRPKKPSKKATKTKAKSPSPATSNTQDLQILTQTLPKHLLNFTAHCSTSFPGSHLPSTLLPYIKSLGPATFALAATTDLYNKHMRALYYNHHDLAGIVSTLEEMEQQVYEFDIVTFDLLGKVVRKASQAQEGKLGEGLKALWGGERARTAVRKIVMWRRKVERRIQEKALREARERESEGEAEGGEMEG